MAQVFPEMKKKLGFGCMRLPMKDGKINTAEMNKMVDLFIENGFNYFDTAHGYHDGLSEKALKECLTSRHAREEYLLTNKLSQEYFKTQADIRPFFEEQLRLCGVDYFDFYLMHAQDRNNYVHYQNCHAYETALELKKEGRIRHLGLSFHDTPDILDRILSDHPEVEIVQIQFNYVDYDDHAIQSGKCLEVCEKHGKPVLVMEPVKGGSLSNLPDAAKKVFDALGTMSYASYAIRYAAGFDRIVMVLSGMSCPEQMADNISYMKDFHPLSEAEQQAVEQVKEIFHGMELIPCTSCHYCIEENHCPKKILIPDMFACLNAKKMFDDWNQGVYYRRVLTKNNGKAGDCIRCGKCEKVCPQHLEIRKLLQQVAQTFEAS